MTAIALASLFMVYGIYLSFYPIDIVKINAPLKVVNSPVKKGEDIRLLMNFTKFHDYRAENKWSLVDGQTYNLTTGQVPRPVGDHIFIRELEVPNNVHPGTYHVEVNIRHRITPFREISYFWFSNEFEIVEAL
jgi:hypothetical protein